MESRRVRRRGRRRRGGLLVLLRARRRFVRVARVHALRDALRVRALERFEEAETLLSKILLVARRAVGESNEITLKMRFNYARALYLDTEATLDDLREAVATLGETAQVARRVLGCAHPFTEGIDLALEHARAVHDARKMPSPGTA